MSVSINAICRKERINQNRTTNIYLRFTIHRRCCYVSTGINIPALHQTTTIRRVLRLPRCCILLKFYIKPQRRAHYLLKFSVLQSFLS